VARIRTIKPDFWQHEELAALPALTRLLAIGLLNYADDEGYFRATPALIRAAIFPFEDSLNVHGMLMELSSTGYLELFETSEGKQFGRITKFTTHQKVSHPQPSQIKEQIKDLEPFTEDSWNPPEPLRPEGKGKEGREPAAVASARFQKPTGEELTEAFRAKGVPEPEREAAKFLNYYESNGWKVGKSKMQSWPHAVGSWCARNFSSQSPAPQQQGIQLVSI
jgi:hypothetical protein